MTETAKFSNEVDHSRQVSACNHLNINSNLIV